MPKHLLKTPPPAKVITPIAEGNAVVEIDEPRTPPAPTVEPVLSIMPSFVDQRKFYLQENQKNQRLYNLATQGVNLTIEKILWWKQTNR